MKNYLETDTGGLLIDGVHIPSDESNRHYRQALAQASEGVATIEAWSGSQREADWLASEGDAAWKASRSAAVSNSTVTVDGLIFDGDETSQNRMSRAVISASSDAEQTLWVLADNSAVMVTALQLRTALKLAGQAQTAAWVKP